MPAGCEDRGPRKADLTLCYAGGERWHEEVNFCSGTLASILGPNSLSETRISLLDSKRLMSIKDHCSVAGLCVLLVTLLSPDNQTDSNRHYCKIYSKVCQAIFTILGKSFPYYISIEGDHL